MSSSKWTRLLSNRSVNTLIFSKREGNEERNASGPVSYTLRSPHDSRQQVNITTLRWHSSLSPGGEVAFLYGAVGVIMQVSHTGSNGQHRGGTGSSPARVGLGDLRLPAETAGKLPPTDPRWALSTSRTAFSFCSGDFVLLMLWLSLLMKTLLIAFLPKD